jgi:squalene-hopene/tetraprenyl-beta-curcumene cyclase
VPRWFEDLGAEDAREAARKGAEYLADKIEHGEPDPPSPIGLYFARQWYFEEFYSLIITVAALEQVRCFYPA